jgi:hypothetical protein
VGWASFRARLDFTNAHHLALQHLENFDPVGVGQSLHDLEEISHAAFPNIVITRSEKAIALSKP